MSEVIECLACTPESRKHRGCGTCGGYGYIYSQWTCPGCSVKAWLRPGAHTVFDGKTFTSMNGVTLVWRKGGQLCFDCDSKPRVPAETSMPVALA